MNAIDKLTMQDFGRPLDPTLFSAWKERKRAQSRMAIVDLILYAAGFGLLLILGGFIGLICFFTLALLGIILALPTMSKANKIQRDLGITNIELKQAIKQARGR